MRNLANDGTTTQASWPSPGRDYWLSVTRLSLKYPHDKFGTKDGAHDTDSIGLYQQRPAYGWGNYGNSTGTTDPEGVVQRLLDPRWEAMAFFGGSRTAAPKGGLLDVAGWQTMAPTVAADAVQQSNHPDFYAQWESPATTYVNNNQDAPAIDLPWFPGGGARRVGLHQHPDRPGARRGWAAIRLAITGRPRRFRATGSGWPGGRSTPTRSTDSVRSTSTTKARSELSATGTAWRIRPAR